MTGLNSGNNIDSIIYSFKNVLLIYIIITLPFYFVLNSISIYYYALAIFIFILSYYLFYIFSKTMVEFLSSGINFIGMVLMAISLLLLLLKSYDIVFIIFPVLLSFSSSIIDNSIKIRNRIRNINNLFMILYFLLIIVFILFFGIRFELIYISFILISIALGIISIFYDNNIIEYKKVTLNKRLRFYIVSLSDIRRIKNLNILLIMILINSLIYLSIITVFTFIPVLAIHYGNYNKFIVKFLIIILISFFAYFIGALIKNNFYYIVSFFGVPVFILSIIFIITVKNNFDYLYYGLFLIPVIALFIPGYYKYRNKKFMLSEVYYINKFVNFFSMFFIIIAPLTGLYFYNKPRIVISIAMFPIFIVIILSLKFINYSNVIHIITKKHKN